VVLLPTGISGLGQGVGASPPTPVPVMSAAGALWLRKIVIKNEEPPQPCRSVGPEPVGSALEQLMLSAIETGVGRTNLFSLALK
jgi:hypothetical protein